MRIIDRIYIDGSFVEPHERERCRAKVTAACSLRRHL
jgi:hypothetical protein